MYLQPQRQKVPAQPRARAKTCVITGFDAFGKGRFNPSEDLVSELPSLVPGTKTRADGVVLSTCCKEAWSTLRRTLTAEQPEILILTGLAQKRERLSLERFALNIRDYRIPDNGGHIFDGDRIEPRGADALSTTVPLPELRDYLNKKGYPSEVSNYAGSYVCNETYFRALSHQSAKGFPKLVLFVHLPLPGRWARAVQEEGKRRGRKALSGRDAQVADMRDGVLEIARFCCDLLT